MIALTVRQPFATQIVTGVKSIENRSKPTSVRGLLVIHAGKQPHPYAKPEVIAAMKRGELPSRAVLGTVQLVGCHEADADGCARAGCPYRGGFLPGIWPAGDGPLFHWELADPREFMTPIPNVRGQLGIWRITSPSIEHLVGIAETVAR